MEEMKFDDFAALIANDHEGWKVPEFNDEMKAKMGGYKSYEGQRDDILEEFGII